MGGSPRPHSLINDPFRRRRIFYTPFELRLMHVHSSCCKFMSKVVSRISMGHWHVTSVSEMVERGKPTLITITSGAISITREAL